MFNEDWEKFFNKFKADITDKASIKEKEYSNNSDRFCNFKRAASLKNTSPERALEGMMTKHIISIYDLLDRMEIYDDEIPLTIWKEKIIDTIIYLSLLYGMLYERNIEKKDLNNGNA